MIDKIIQNDTNQITINDNLMIGQKLSLNLLTCVFILILIIGCTREQTTSPINRSIPEQWYEGKAEINTYTLHQQRYGEIHEGEAVLIFVTEDFHTDKQVKIDRPQEISDDKKQKVLKLNAVRKFNTGVYPYSVMKSVFTPVDITELPATLKITHSVQEWCGQVYTQMNKEDDGYSLSTYSYFESEGDRQYQLPKVLLEDELWTLLRVDPDIIPLGQQLIMPGQLYHRFQHKQPEASSAVIELNRDGDIGQLNITYENIDRQLSITFKNDSLLNPILSWTEGSINDETKRTTAHLINSEWLDYWTRNKAADSLIQNRLFNKQDDQIED